VDGRRKAVGDREREDLAACFGGLGEWQERKPRGDEDEGKQPPICDRLMWPFASCGGLRTYPSVSLCFLRGRGPAWQLANTLCLAGGRF
jgi:hypothetical protein